MVQFPPFGGGEAASWTGVVPKVQITSVKNADNGVLWARWSAFWAQWCLGWCVCLLGSWWLGPGVHLWGRFASESQSVLGVPAKMRREQRVETDPTATANDDREQVRTPARARHTDCG